MNPRTPSPVRRDLVNSTRDGAGWSVMVGLGETYIPAFALAVGLGPVAAGLVATVPLLLGAGLQMAGPAAARRTGSLRRFVVACSVLQALCFLPLAAGALLGAFAVLFLGAGVGRAVSARFLHLHREVWVPRFRTVALPDLLRRLRSSPAGKLLLGLGVLQAAVYLAWPFTAPYALDSLRFSYREYMVLIAVSYLSRMAAGPLLARAADRWGPRTLLLATAVAFVPVHGLWVLSPSLPWLAAVQALWGVLLGALDLATLMLYFEFIPREERVAVLAWFNLVVAGALTAGSLAGGAMLEALGKDREAYHAVFLASTALRVAGAALLFRIPRGRAA